MQKYLLVMGDFVHSHTALSKACLSEEDASRKVAPRVAVRMASNIASLDSKPE